MSETKLPQGFVAGHNEEAQGRELRGNENLEWNTDLVETMELENLICQATQGLYIDWTQHEPRQAHVDSTGNRRDAAIAVHRRGC